MGTLREIIVNWKKTTRPIEYIDFDESKECAEALLKKDLYTVKEPLLGLVLREAYGLCSSREIGEINVGDRIVIIESMIVIVRKWDDE